MSRHFCYQAGIIFKSAKCPLRSRVLRLTEASWNDCGKLSNPEVAVRNMMADMMKPFMTQSLKIGVILHSFVRALFWCLYIISFHVFKVAVLVFGCSSLGLTERHPPQRLTVGQLLYSSVCRGAGWVTWKDVKTKFCCGNIVPKQWTMLGFLQHTSANTIYIWNNKTIQQLRILHMILSWCWWNSLTSANQIAQIGSWDRSGNHVPDLGGTGADPGTIAFTKSVKTWMIMQYIWLHL